jgi:NAD+--dinitrogen-reductase ADP-D-ribosyltransferase
MLQSTHNNPSLPKQARRLFNRCNLPAGILGSLTYQQHPAPLTIDGVNELYREIFERLQKLENAVVRSRHFMAFMSAQFQLESPEEMGFEEESRLDRSKATYLRLLRGWLFNPDSQEGAVLKGWAESRFGLVPRFHHAPIRNQQDESYRSYEQEWARGLYNTNALENQLDVLFGYSQFELVRKYKQQTHITLYRGCNHLDEYETFDKNDARHIILLNNLNSFSDSRERADEFGDYVMQVEIPLSKIVFFNDLLPGVLSGEGEYIVLGGLTHATLIN